MAKDWMKALGKLEGVVDKEYDPFAHVIRTPSPSVNFTFGNTHGLPLGYTLILFGPPEGGKSVLSNAMIGQFHKDDLDGIALKYNTEFRESVQLTPAQMEVFGIDPARYQPYEVNTPDGIFDKIETDIAALCQEGAPIKLVVVDSINNIQGRRSMNADSIMTQQIGDLALTLQEGLKRILPIQRKYHIALVLTAHVRAEMDTLEVMRGNKTKMAASFGVKHYGEYFMSIEQNRNKAGGQTLLGEKLEDNDKKDLMDKAEKTGHRIRVRMVKSSVGPRMRTGEFTLDYHRGIINTHEEAFLLGVNRGVIGHPNQVSYQFGDKVWRGKEAMLQAMLDEPELQNAILTEIKKQDMAGRYRLDDMLAEQMAASEEEKEQHES